MHYLIENLMKGDGSMAKAMKESNARWAELLDDIATVAEPALAARLSNEQHWFENIAGGRAEGKDLMAWTAFGYLYSTAVGFEDNRPAALKLANAFKASSCSIEVKHAADRAAKSYRLSE